MENERKKKLLETMKSFNKGQRSEILSFGNEAEDKELIPTGIKTIDKFIGGGTKRGTFTVIYGGQSVGKSTLVLQTIANAQKKDLICCYVDLEHTFDKDRAISLGISLDDLILAEKCENAEQALEIIRTLCKQKVVDLIVVDSVQAMSPKNEQENKGKERELASKEIAELARTLSKFFRVVAPDVFNAQASVIMIGQVRIAGIGSFYTHADMTGGEALKHWASTRCFIRKGQTKDSPVSKIKEYFIDPDGKIRYSTNDIQIGFDSVIKLEKTKSSSSAKEGQDIHVPFLYDKGFVDEVIMTEDIPIKIDAENDEEQKIIEDYLIEKGLMDKNGNIGKIIPSQGGTGETKCELPKEEKMIVINNTNPEAVAKFTRQDVVSISGGAIEEVDGIITTTNEPKKKKRGRPSKKEK